MPFFGGLFLDSNGHKQGLLLFLGIELVGEKNKKNNRVPVESNLSIVVVSEEGRARVRHAWWSRSPCYPAFFLLFFYWSAAYQTGMRKGGGPYRERDPSPLRRRFFKNRSPPNEMKQFFPP